MKKPNPVVHEQTIDEKHQQKLIRANLSYEYHANFIEIQLKLN